LDSKESVHGNGKEARAVGLERRDDVVVDVAACGRQGVPRPHTVGHHLSRVSADSRVPVIHGRRRRLGVSSAACQGTGRRVEPPKRPRRLLRVDAVGGLARAEQLLAQRRGSVVQHGGRLGSHHYRE